MLPIFFPVPQSKFSNALAVLVLVIPCLCFPQSVIHIADASPPLWQVPSVAAVTFENLQGRRTTLGDYLKKGPVLLSFWALWCEPCKAEMKALDRLSKAYKDSSLTVLGLNIDSPRSLSKVKAYIAAQKFGFEVGLDPNSRVFEFFQGTSIPLSLIIAPDGRVVKTRMGYLPADEESLKEDLSKILKEIRSRENE